MKKKVKVFGIEDEPNDKQLIKRIVGNDSCTFQWATDSALNALEKENYQSVLNEIQKSKPDCLIVDLGLTVSNRKLIEEEKGKKFPFAERAVEELGGGFVVISEVLKNNLIPKEHICIFTEHAINYAKILTILSKKFYSYEIPVYQKGDKDTEYKLREFVYEIKGIKIRYVYTLIDQSDDNVRENIIKDLESVSESLDIKWINFPRMSLDNAKEYWEEDKSVIFDLAFFDLSLEPSDDEMFEEIKDKFAPRLTLDSFTSLKFAKEFKKIHKSCTMIFLTNIEKRTLVIFLLSPEVDGDWVIHKTTLTKSLAALLIKLFIMK